MKKVVRLGTLKTYGGRGYSIYCKIEYKEDKQELTIGGVEGPLTSGNCLGGCGQIDTHLNNPDVIKSIGLAPGWTREKLKRFFDIWDKWHLNTFKPGCEHQRDMGWEKESYDKHLEEPCPICGYKFGTKWNRVDVPKEVIEFLFSLPDTDKEPAWV